MHTFMGLEVVIWPMLDDIPKMQLTPIVEENLPPAFAAEINAWMREFFGTESKAVVVSGRVAIGPKTAAALRSQTEIRNA